MDGTLLGVLGTLGGAIIGGVSTYMAGNHQRDLARLQRQVGLLARQVSAYWQLEKAYVTALHKAEKGRRPEKSILEQMRASTEETHGVRPTMTAAEADRIFETWT